MSFSPLSLECISGKMILNLIDAFYPKTDHSGTPSDRENFTKLLQAVKAALEMLTRETGKDYGLTAALPCDPDKMDDIEVGKLTSILSEFNLMS